MKGVKIMQNLKSKVFLSLLLLAILIMSVGYATFATQLHLNGTAEIISSWNVRITNITVQNKSEGCDAGTPTFTNTSATFHAKFTQPGDTITYQITIENLGILDAKLNNVLFQEEDKNDTDSLLFQTTEIAPLLKAGEKTSFNVSITYNKNTNEQPKVTTKTLTGIIEYVQA